MRVGARGLGASSTPGPTRLLPHARALHAAFADREPLYPGLGHPRVAGLGAWRPARDEAGCWLSAAALLASRAPCCRFGPVWRLCGLEPSRAVRAGPAASRGAAAAHAGAVRRSWRSWRWPAGRVGLDAAAGWIGVGPGGSGRRRPVLRPGSRRRSGSALVRRPGGLAGGLGSLVQEAPPVPARGGLAARGARGGRAGAALERARATRPATSTGLPRTGAPRERLRRASTRRAASPWGRLGRRLPTGYISRRFRARGHSLRRDPHRPPGRPRPLARFAGRGAPGGGDPGRGARPRPDLRDRSRRARRDGGRRRVREKEKGPQFELRPFGRAVDQDEKIPGNVLLSHQAALTVPSAQEGLTAVFGMGTGVTPPPWSPG